MLKLQRRRLEFLKGGAPSISTNPAKTTARDTINLPKCVIYVANFLSNKYALMINRIPQQDFSDDILTEFSVLAKRATRKRGEKGTTNHRRPPQRSVRPPRSSLPHRTRSASVRMLAAISTDITEWEVQIE